MPAALSPPSPPAARPSPSTSSTPASTPSSSSSPVNPSTTPTLCSQNSQPFPPSSSAADEHQITVYLSRIQRGSHVLPFDCTLAIDDSFCLIAFSENVLDLLDLVPQSVLVLGDQRFAGQLTIGIEVRSLFTPSSSVPPPSARSPSSTPSGSTPKTLTSSSTPSSIASTSSSTSNPSDSEDPALSIAGAFQSQKLAVRVVSKLQSLPDGDIKLLCDIVVGHVRELTRYNQVMVYKFHEDEHGEVVAHVRMF